MRDSSRPRAAAACRRPFHRRHRSREETRPEIPLQLPGGERIIARETECQRHRQCPESAFHNIIPSELCNSVRHRHFSASEKEVCVGQKPAKTSNRAADYTIRIMLRTLRHQDARAFPSNSRARRRQERAWLQWPVRHRPFASPAPGRGIGAPRPPIPLHRCRSASASSILD